MHAQVTMREVQGGIIGSAFIIMAFALSGLLRAVLHYISPITVAVNIAIVGLSLYGSGFRWSSDRAPPDYRQDFPVAQALQSCSTSIPTGRRQGYHCRTCAAVTQHLNDSAKCVLQRRGELPRAGPAHDCGAHPHIPVPQERGAAPAHWRVGGTNPGILLLRQRLQCSMEQHWRLQRWKEAPCAGA